MGRPFQMVNADLDDEEGALRGLVRYEHRAALEVRLSPSPVHQRGPSQTSSFPTPSPPARPPNLTGSPTRTRTRTRRSSTAARSDRRTARTAPRAATAVRTRHGVCRQASLATGPVAPLRHFLIPTDVHRLLAARWLAPQLACRAFEFVRPCVSDEASKRTRHLRKRASCARAAVRRNP